MLVLGEVGGTFRRFAHRCFPGSTNPRFPAVGNYGTFKCPRVETLQKPSEYQNSTAVKIFGRVFRHIVESRNTGISYEEDFPSKREKQ